MTEAYLDEKHNIVSPEVAKWKVITKYDSHGVVDEVWVDLKK